MPARDSRHSNHLITDNQLSLGIRRLDNITALIQKLSLNWRKTGKPLTCLHGGRLPATEARELPHCPRHNTQTPILADVVFQSSSILVLDGGFQNLDIRDQRMHQVQKGPFSKDQILQGSSLSTFWVPIHFSGSLFSVFSCEECKFTHSIVWEFLPPRLLDGQI